VKLPEIIACGIYDSSIDRPDSIISKDREVLQFEVELPIGEGGISYINSASKPIKDNMLICVKPYQKRHTRFPFKCYYIHLAIDAGEVYETLSNAPDFMEPEDIDRYRRIFLEIISIHNSFSNNTNIKLFSLILELIYLISEEINKHNIKGASSNNIPVIEKTLKYINGHLTEDLSLEALASLNTISAIHFHNIFKKTMGITLRKYVEEKRLEKAMNMIITTNRTLTEIAFECGFSSQSYFSYAFKRKMHCTPREYMQKMNSRYEI
jgi:AraC-like DNA-binding protein